MLEAQPQPSASSPDARAQAFEAQENAPIHEVQSGERLLIEAYVAFWVIAMAFVQIMWFRQRAISRRLDALESAIDKHAAGKPKA
jgi:hypothetical protein